FAGDARTPVGNGVEESAIGIFSGKRGRIVFAFQILASGDKNDRALHGRIVGLIAGGLQGVEQETGVREIGARLAPAIAGAAIVDVRLVDFAIGAPLNAFYILVGGLDLLFVAAVLFVGLGEAHNADAGFIVLDG